MPSSTLKVLPTVSTRLRISANLDPSDVPISPSLIEHECQICLFEYPSFIMVSSCSKGHKFCKTCLVHYLKAKVPDFKAENIRCPQDSCTHPCNEQTIRSLLNDNERKLYEEKKLKKAVSQNPCLRFCPRAGCSRVYESSKATRYTICKCHSKICNACGELWHEGRTCQQISDERFEEYVKKNGNKIKFCVKCKTAVQRTEGCLHITCPACDYEWCWSCGREYTPLHSTKCPREWMPELPKKGFYGIKLTWDLKRTEKLMEIIVIILLIPVKLLFFGFFICDLLKVIRAAEKMGTKLFVFIFAAAISLVYNGIIFGLVGAITEASSGKGKQVLIGVLGLVVIPFLLFIIRQIINVCLKERSDNKKWKTRIANNFEFVTTQKSILHVQESPSPATAVPIGNILDGIFDDEESRNLKDFVEHQRKKQNNDLGEILDRVFDEDNDIKDKSIKLGNVLEGEEENVPNFDKNDVLKGVVDVEDEKELSEIKVV